MRNPTIRTLAVLACALLCGANPFERPWALVEPGTASETRREARVAVTQVDGVSTHSTRRSDPIEPGRRRVTLHFESGRGIFRPEFMDIDLDLAPCTRYRVVARYQSKTGPRWEPVIYNEPIGECEIRFGKGGKGTAK